MTGHQSSALRTSSKTQKKDTRLLRRRLRLSKQQILTAVCPPRNLTFESAKSTWEQYCNAFELEILLRNSTAAVARSYDVQL
jgi:hypothetical protein